jgi:glycerol kinase
MQLDYGNSMMQLRIDGGAANNSLMVQFQADISNINITRPDNLETTALGAAYLAGLATGFWKLEDLKESWQINQQFTPNLPFEQVDSLKKFWQKAVVRAKNWAE